MLLGRISRESLLTRVRSLALTRVGRLPLGIIGPYSRRGWLHRVTPDSTGRRTRAARPPLPTSRAAYSVATSRRSEVSRFTDATQARVLALLTAERADAQEQAAVLAADLEGIIAAATSVATDDEHDPEGTTIAYERAQAAALLTGARARLREIDGALARLAAGEYGRCGSCGEQIAPERLAARPATTTCISCANLPH